MGMLSYAKCLCAVAAVGDMRVQDPPRRPQSGGHGVVGRRGDEHTAVRSSAPSRSLARVRSCCAAGRCLLAASARRSRAHARCDLGGLRVWGSGGHGIIRRSRASTTAETAHSGARTTGNDSRRPWVPSRVRPVPGEGSSAEAEVDAEQRAGSIDLCASTSNGEEQQTKTKERMEYHVCVCVVAEFVVSPSEIIWFQSSLLLLAHCTGESTTANVQGNVVAFRTARKIEFCTMEREPVPLPTCRGQPILIFRSRLIDR